MPESPCGAGGRLEPVANGIAMLRLDRPRQLNALTDDTLVEILRLLDAGLGALVVDGPGTHG